MAQPPGHCAGDHVSASRLTVDAPRNIQLARRANDMARRSVYSHYLPLKRYVTTTSRATSVTKDAARSPTKEKETRNRRAASDHSSKRRSTLNSREAGYNEAEALRRAIEASKEDASPELGGSANRRPKRGRSDSQEYVAMLQAVFAVWLTFSQKTGKHEASKDKFSIHVAVVRQECRRFGRGWSSWPQRSVQVESARCDSYAKSTGRKDVREGGA